MRLGGRLAAAIEILDDILARRRPVADALKDWGLSHRFAGSGDRAAIGNIVYDALRMKLSHAWLMNEESGVALAYATLFRQWGYTAESLSAALDGDKFAPSPLSSAALEAFTSNTLKDAPAHVQADLPEWLVASFQRNFGDRWLDEAVALNERPSLDLRVNTLKADREKVLKALSRSSAEVAPLAPFGVRIAPGGKDDRLPNVTAEVAFQKGWFEVQDEGSQLAAAMVMPKEGEQVLDYCAGGGGKTLSMAAAMNNKGQVHAYDADRKRLAPIVERLKRAGTRNVQIHEDGSSLQTLGARFDRVLIDAPCTGTGTWRRRPDTKWRLTEKTLAERNQQQSEVLDAASGYVKPGGKLAYVTCSLLPEENQDQVAAFLERNSEFRQLDARPLFDTATNGKGSYHSNDGLSVTLSPATSNTDGFFFAMLERVS